MPIFDVNKALRKAKGLARKGDVDAAAELYKAVLERFPKNNQAIKALASIQRGPASAMQVPLQEELQDLVRIFNEGDLHQALAVGQSLASQYPDQPLIHNVVGAANTSLQRYENAIASYTKAIHLQPDYAEAHNNLGTVCNHMGLHEEAIAHYRKAILYDPNFFEAYNNLGNAFTDSGRSEEAISNYTSAIRIKPNFAAAASKLVFQLAQICDWDALQSYAASIPGLGVLGGQVFPFDLLHIEDSPARHLQRAELYARKTYPQTELSAITRPEEKPGRLRIGYFSADFHDHATMYLMARLFELHNPNEVEIYAYSYHDGDDDDDSMRNRLRESVEEFHDVRHLGDSDIAKLCRSHQLDIAVDLKGYTQHTRLGVFSYRLAPIQISYLGYPGTTGASFMDYIIADQVVIPEEQRVHYSESIIYLPHCYQVNDDTRRIADKAITREDAGLPETGFVFCCFNNNYKIGPNEFDIWMRLLQQVKGSVLWLFKSNKWAQENLQKEAQKRGVHPERIVFADRMPHAEHLARLRLANLFLDTFNYNAHTIASDALWSGLPVVTMPGEGFAARVAASLLAAIDLPELIAVSESDYEQLALDLALNPEKLAALKTKLSGNRLTTPLFNTGLFVRHIEEAYQQVYQKYFNGEPPDSILILP